MNSAGHRYPSGEWHEKRESQSSCGFSWKHKRPTAFYRLNRWDGWTLTDYDHATEVFRMNFLHSIFFDDVASFVIFRREIIRGIIRMGNSTAQVSINDTFAITAKYSIYSKPDVNFLCSGELRRNELQAFGRYHWIE